MATIAENLQVVKARIDEARARCGGAPEVTLLAVSKGHGVERIREAAAAGQKAFGENYVQDALPKMDALPQLEWHLIGALQSNKTRVAAERFDWIQTVDREKIARRLSDQRPVHRPPLNVLVQVNISGESGKSGAAIDEVAGLARTVAALPRLRLRGLMAIPRPGDTSGLHRMKQLFDQLKGELRMDTLSMGMSDDLETAIAAGSTMVRVGTAIFGQRNKEKSAA
ncbi:MAG TPA: YggS family pyridoxal phosphate-dependent enzyme [Burkholderiales bacterium]